MRVIKWVQSYHADSTLEITKAKKATNHSMLQAYLLYVRPSNIKSSITGNSLTGLSTDWNSNCNRFSDTNWKSQITIIIQFEPRS